MRSVREIISCRASQATRIIPGSLRSTRWRNVRRGQHEHRHSSLSPLSPLPGRRAESAATNGQFSTADPMLPGAADLRMRTGDAILALAAACWRATPDRNGIGQDAANQRR